MRLDKYIASVTDYSRTDAKRFIKNKNVTINDGIVTNAAHSVNIDSDQVCLHEETLNSPAPRYFMLHKPIETVCANEDSEHPTIIDLIDEPNAEKLQIAGRLDKDTTGLVLLTDDGKWNHHLTSPRSDCFKTYRVNLAEAITPEAITQLENGILLRNEKQPTQKAKVTLIDDTTIELSIREGKYHQVKRMLAAVGNHVSSLHRLQIGTIVLDDNLEIGEYRPLTHAEIQQ